MTACGKAVCLGLTIVFFLTGVLIAVVIVTKDGNAGHQNGQSKESSFVFVKPSLTSFRQNNNCDNPPELESGTSGP